MLIVWLFGLLIVGLDDLMMNDSPSLKKNEWQLTIPFGDIQSFENSGQKRTKHACMAHSQNFTTSTVSIIAYLHTHTHYTTTSISIDSSLFWLRGIFPGMY